MNDLQKCQLEILKEFIRICTLHRLQYYLVGGTCLGAVRHQGFIPWDDDIDVAMPRKDYDRFIALQDQMKSPYFIQTYKSDPNYIYNYAKIRDSSTTFIENYFACHQINHGVWIDVFPLDGISERDEAYAKFRRKIRYTWHQVYLMYLPSLKRKIRKETLWKDIPLNLVASLFFFLNVGKYRNQKVDKKVTRIDFEKAFLIANYFGTNPSKEAMPKDIFLEGSKGTFEGVEVILPKDYHTYLSLLFNDYMTLPPEDKRQGHHHDKGLSLNQSYREYMREHRL